MSNLTNRVNQLEKDSGVSDVYNYMCVISEGWAVLLLSEEERAQGYKIQPYIPERGGTGGESFYLATLEELETFAARPDVHLLKIIVGHEEPDTTGE